MPFLPSFSSLIHRAVRPLPPRGRHVELRYADTDKENTGGAPFLGANHKVTDLAANAKRKFVLRFGGDKAASDMDVVRLKIFKIADTC